MKFIAPVFLSLLVVFTVSGCASNKSAEVVEQPVIKEKVKTIPIAVVETEKGTWVMKFFSEDAPKTVQNFVNLSKQGFYDGLIFHRVVKQPAPFVIQAGDPNGDGTGGPGYTIPAEFNARSHLEGSLAMARTEDPNSGGSQFYICLSPQPQLDGKYTVFGQIIEGLENIHKINVGDKIKKITIQERPVE